MSNVAIFQHWKPGISGKRVPAMVRTDWFHYMLLRQPKHFCAEAQHAVVNTWELPLARRAAGTAWPGSKPHGFIFIIPQKRNLVPCCSLAVVLPLQQPWAMPRPCQGKMRHLAEVKTVPRACQQRRSNWGWSISPCSASLSKAGCSPTCPASY